MKKFKNIDLHFVLMLIQGTTEKSRLEPEEITALPQFPLWNLFPKAASQNHTLESEFRIKSQKQGQESEVIFRHQNPKSKPKA